MSASKRLDCRTLTSPSEFFGQMLCSSLAHTKLHAGGQGLAEVLVSLQKPAEAQQVPADGQLGSTRGSRASRASGDRLTGSGGSSKAAPLAEPSWPLQVGSADWMSALPLLCFWTVLQCGRGYYPVAMEGPCRMGALRGVCAHGACEWENVIILFPPCHAGKPQRDAAAWR